MRDKRFSIRNVFGVSVEGKDRVKDKKSEIVFGDRAAKRRVRLGFLHEYVTSRRQGMGNAFILIFKELEQFSASNTDMYRRVGKI